MTSWNIISIKNKIVGINGLIGLNAIRVSKERVALFGGKIVPKEMLPFITPELLVKGGFQKNEKNNYIDFFKRKSYSFL